jgi:putative ABC transport system permease protein
MRDVRFWRWRKAEEDDIDREISVHLELAADERIQAGAPAGDAERAARREFGSVTLMREEAAEVRTGARLEQVWRDVGYAIRTMRRSPGLTSTVVVTLALGIGANSAIFALVDATLIRPLPFPQANRLVMVWERNTRIARGLVAPLNFHDWDERNRTFDGMAAVFNYARRLSAADGTTEQVPAQQVTPRFFEILGARPVLGRMFLSSDVAVPPNVVVLGEALWRARFGADPTVIGRIIQLDGQPFTVVGVATADFQGIPPASLWTVWAELPGMDARARRFMRVIGRMKPAVNIDTASADLQRIAEGLAREYPRTNLDTGIIVEPLRDALVGADIQSTSLLFLAVVGFVLLMCCANVANLLLARTAARTREVAIRSALGASRLRIVRQLFIESLLLSATGGVLAVVVGAAILRVAPSLLPRDLLPSIVVLSFDARVLMFCAFTAFVVGMLCGIAPAWQATGLSLVHALTNESRGTTRGGGRLRSLFVIGEVAAAVLLLCGAGLLLRTLLALGSVDAGYRAANVLTVQPSIDYGLRSSMFGSEEALSQYLQGVEREVRSIPAVASAGWGTSLPLGGFNASGFEIVGHQSDSSHSQPLAHQQLVSPAYFPTLGIRIVAGRTFSAQDTASSTPVCIISEAVVRQYLDGRNPIGTRLSLPQLNIGSTHLVVREVIGVAADVRLTLNEVEEFRSIYVPMQQNPWSFAILVVKPSAGSAQAIIPAIRAAFARVDRRVPVTQVRTLDEVMRLTTARPRFRAVLVAAFAALALLLAMVGVFGILAYSVQQRRREFGLRIALGATAGAVTWQVLSSAGRLVGFGAVIGLLLAGIFARSLSTFLFGVRPLDILTFAGVSVLMAVTAALASAIPALRASHVDPMVALRIDS